MKCMIQLKLNFPSKFTRFQLFNMAFRSPRIVEELEIPKRVKIIRNEKIPSNHRLKVVENGKFKKQQILEYYSDDECGLINHDKPDPNHIHKRNFFDLESKQLVLFLKNENLIRRGSIYLLKICSEIVHREMFKVIIEKSKTDSKKHFLKEKLGTTKLFLERNEKSFIFLKEKLNTIFDKSDKRVIHKKKFILNDEFINVLSIVDNDKLRGDYLLLFITTLNNSLLDRNFLWNKFFNCFSLSIDEIINQESKLMKCSIKTLFLIFEQIYIAYETNKFTLNFNLSILKESLTKIYEYARNNIPYSPLEKSAHFLGLLKIADIKNNEEIENLVFNQIRTVSGQMSEDDFLRLIRIFSFYFEDSSRNEFSFIEMKLIEKSKNKRSLILNELEAKKKEQTKNKLKLKIDEFTTLYSFEKQILDIWGKYSSWLPFKYLEYLVNSLLEQEINLSNIDLSVDFILLFVRFSYYDSRYLEKIVQAINLMDLQNLSFEVKYKIFILAISNRYFDKSLKDLIQVNLVKTLNSNINKDTPRLLVNKIEKKTIESIISQQEYYATTLKFKNNNYFISNEAQYKEVMDLVFELS